MRKNLLLLTVVLVLLSSVNTTFAKKNNTSQNKKLVESTAIEALFTKENITGTFVVYENGQNSITVSNEKRAKKPFYPASTFKIPHSIIGLATGTVSSVDEVFYNYDGKPQYLKSWEKDMSLREAIKVSNVSAYQVLARGIGLKAMQQNITKMNYGNKKIGGQVDRFWLNGPLKITAIQQIQFLDKLATQKLPYSKDIQKSVRSIMELESTDNYKLFGKTGFFSKRKQTPVAWFVGWVEQNGKIYSFALNMDILSEEQDLPKREKIAKKALNILGLAK